MSIKQRTNPVPTFNALDFIGNLLYQAECAKTGTTGARWWCHGARGSRRKWRKKAREAIEQWAQAEREAMDTSDKERSLLDFFAH